MGTKPNSRPFLAAALLQNCLHEASCRTIRPKDCNSRCDFSIAWRNRLRVSLFVSCRTKPPWRPSAVPRSRTHERGDSRQFGAVCEAALARGLQVRFRARGQSMQPNILDGDVALVAPIAGTELRRGEIALTRGEDGYRLHRVIEWDRHTNYVVTRGDAGQQNDTQDELALGRVIAV